MPKTKSKKIKMLFSLEDIEKLHSSKKTLNIELIITHANVKVLANGNKQEFQIEK